MHLALLEAQKALAEGEIPVGAVLAAGNEVVASGHNRREQNADFLAHAEIETLKNAQQKKGDWRMENARLYVTLEPCPMCAGALLQARVGEVIFGAYDKQYGAAGSVLNLLDYPGLSLSSLVRGGILRESCEELLEVFFRNLRAR